MRLPDGVTGGSPVEVAPKSAPMSTEGLNALAAQKRREAEEMEGILAKRQQAEQAEQERIRQAAEARRLAEQEKREKAEQERLRWAEINAKVMPSGQVYSAGHLHFDQVILCGQPVVPMLVGDDLVVKPLGLALEVFKLESPVVTAEAAELLVGLYQAEAERRFSKLLNTAADLLGNGPWLYTPAMPHVVVRDAGPDNRHTGKPSDSHKQICAVWGDCYLHNPSKGE